MAEKQNPFILGIATDSAFCNRKSELADLKQIALNGQKAVLISPRRYGKSSLVLRLFESLKEEGVETVYVDFFPISSEKDFAERLALAIIKSLGGKATGSHFKAKITSLFKRLIPSMDLTPDGVSFSVKVNQETKYDLLLDDIFDGLHAYAKKFHKRICVAMDEFQEIVELTDAKKIEGIVRSHVQRHPEISYLFIGSRRRVLRDMFTGKSRPFYKSALLYELKEIAEQEFCAFIMDQFNNTGKQCSLVVAKWIYAKAKGYPYYVQKLAMLSWDRTSSQCHQEIANAAYEALCRSEGLDFESIWSGLTLGQKELLKALAKEPAGSLFAKDYLARHELSLGGTQKSLKALLSKDLVERIEDGTYRLTDPIFSRWVSGT